MIKHHQPSPVKPKRVAILGATGFVAGDLARHLKELGVETVAVSSRQIDLLKPESVEQLGGVIQPDDALVVTSCLTPDKGRDVRTFMKNLSMMEHLCAFIEKARCAHVVYVSSDAVYDEQASLVRETTPRNPASFHGLMHLAREEMLRFVLEKLPVPFCMVRPGLIYGAADTHNGYGPNRFLRAAIKDRKITLFGNGEEQRDHVYIKDVSRFIGLCLFQRTEGVLNIVTGRAISFYDVAQVIVKLCPHPVQLECLPRTTPITHRHFDVSLRLKEFPGFDCTTTGAGLAETFAELRSQARI